MATNIVSILKNAKPLARVERIPGWWLGAADMREAFAREALAAGNEARAREHFAVANEYRRRVGVSVVG